MIWIGVLCFMLAAAILVSLLHDLILWAYKTGYQAGRAESEKWFVEQGRNVDQVRQEIWREESRQ